MPRPLLPLIDRTYTLLARSALIVRAALVIRRITACIVGHRFAQGGIEFERNGEAWFLRELAPSCRTFLDVGANVGAWSALMLATAADARGVAYEPSSTALTRLRGRLGRQDRLEIVPAAVSDAPGELVFYEEAEAGETSSLVAGHSNAGAVARPVPVVTIDAELERLGLERVDLLKIDAEGFDLHVLRGASRALAERRVGAVQFEYNAPWAWAGATLGAATRLLQSSGMEVFVLQPGALRTFDSERVGEFFSYANFVALGPAARERLAPFVSGDVLA